MGTMINRVRGASLKTRKWFGNIGTMALFLLLSGILYSIWSESGTLLGLPDRYATIFAGFWILVFVWGSVSMGYEDTLDTEATDYLPSGWQLGQLIALVVLVAIPFYVMLANMFNTGP
jgi:hypothetical protein